MQTGFQPLMFSGIGKADMAASPRESGWHSALIGQSDSQIQRRL